MKKISMRSKQAPIITDHSLDWVNSAFAALAEIAMDNERGNTAPANLEIAIDDAGQKSVFIHIVHQGSPMKVQLGAPPELAEFEMRPQS